MSLPFDATLKDILAQLPGELRAPTTCQNMTQIIEQMCKQSLWQNPPRRTSIFAAIDGVSREEGQPKTCQNLPQTFGQ
jgi:hypothetical protein